VCRLEGDGHDRGQQIGPFAKDRIHPRDLCVVRRWKQVEAQGPVMLRCVDAIEQQRVEVDIQIESISEALHEGDGTALAAGHAPLLSSPAS